MYDADLKGLYRHKLRPYCLSTPGPAEYNDKIYRSIEDVSYCWIIWPECGAGGSGSSEAQVGDGDIFTAAPTADLFRIRLLCLYLSWRHFYHKSGPS